MASISPTPKLQFFAANGTPLVGGKLYSYAAGTTTPLATYTDAGGGTANPNPVILDSRGEASVWLSSAMYKLRLTTATDVDVWTIDDLNGADQATLATLAASGGSALVGFLQTGSGAQARTVQAKLRDVVSVKDFGAVGNGSANDTTAIQTAINTGASLFFPPGTYRAANLTQTANFQRFCADGSVIIQKNANGPIITSSGHDVEFNGISFRGEDVSPVFTGDNVVSSGNNLRLINCGSRWAYGRAVKATGSHVQIIGTCDIYQTADATASGFDIEIGVSGTSTLYHQLVGIFSSQATGGIKLVDTGSHTILGGQFGKLHITSGTSPSGVNGGMTQGARILGSVNIELASAIFVLNQFSAIAITFAVGTSGCMMIGNVFANGATVVNNGNDNNHIERAVSAGGTIDVKYGEDSSLAQLIFDPGTGGLKIVGPMTLLNNKQYLIENAAGTGTAGLLMSTGDNLSISNAHGAIQFSASGGQYQLLSLPTSSAGLPSGCLWRDSGAGNVIKMVP
jgi:hypothetical protein